MAMKSVLIWDLPTRLLHWGLAASVSAALGIALLVDDHSPLFALHMLFGLAAVGCVVLRVGWGVCGTRHARFADLPLSPATLARYLTEALRGRATRFAGANPGAAWAGLAMLVLVVLLAVTGGVGGGEMFEDAHGVLAYVLLGVITAHLAGLAWHTIRHRENISASMVTGRKLAEPAEEISSTRPVWAAVVFVGAIAWVGGLFGNYDRQAGTVRLPLIGAVVRLGENETKEKGGGHESRDKHRHGEQRRRHHDDD